jgi:hypothetical protein
MKWFWTATACLALALLASHGNSANADDEGYVKVEIKGKLILYQGGSIPGGMVPDGKPPVLVKVGRQLYYGLNLKNMPGGPPTEKQLKEWDGQTVIVEGRLTIEENASPRVDVTRIVLFKKPGPIMN